MRFTHRFRSGVLLNLYAEKEGDRWEFMHSWEGFGQVEAEEMSELVVHLMSGPWGDLGVLTWKAGGYLHAKFLKPEAQPS